MMDAKYLDYFYHHIFLPPKLPQQDDQDEEACRQISQQLLEALGSYANHAESPEAILSCVSLMKNVIQSRDQSGHLDPEKIEKILQKMDVNGMKFFGYTGASSNY